MGKNDWLGFDSNLITAAIDSDISNPLTVKILNFFLSRQKNFKVLP